MKYFLNSCSSGMCGSTNIPLWKTLLQAESLLRSSPRDPISQVGLMFRCECLRCSAMATASWELTMRTTVGVSSLSPTLMCFRNCSTCLGRSLWPWLSSRIRGTLIPSAVASDRKVSMTRWLDEIRERLFTRISYARFAKAYGKGGHKT